MEQPSLPTVAETPAEGWPAQPDLTPTAAFLRICREDVATLLGVAAALEDPRGLRHVERRAGLRRHLAGVIAHCETLRLALEKGRGV